LLLHLYIPKIYKSFCLQQILLMSESRIENCWPMRDGNANSYIGIELLHKTIKQRLGFEDVVSQGAGRTAHLPLQAKTSEKLAAFCGVPKPRLWMAILARHHLSKTMHEALGEPGLIGYLSNARLGVVTQRVENEASFSSKSYSIGPQRGT
jgi:hypothetical protein